MKYFFSCLIVLFVVSSIFNPAKGELIGVSGPVSSMGALPAIIAAPANALDDDVTNEGMQGFDEQQGVTLPVPIAVDGGSIPTGTIVDSHMIFLNSANDESGGMVEIAHYDVKWTFDGDILGVMSNNWGTYEANSTDLLGASGTNYDAPYSARGMESPSGPSGPWPNDGYTKSGNELIVGMSVRAPGDWIRVITEHIGTEEVEEVQIEIKPETLNLKSKGLFTAFIDLPEGYDGEDIDISNVVCQGAPALSGHVTGNGKLIVKFDREDLNPDPPTGDPVTLTVTGLLIGGASYWGSDDIRVIDPGK